MAKKTFKKKVKRNIKKNEKFIIVAITIFVLTGLLGVTYYMYSSQEKKSTSIDNISGDKVQLVKDSLGIKNTTQPINSTLGFSISYDTSLFDASGQVTDPASNSEGYVFGTTYQNDELKESREYSLVKIKPKEVDNKDGQQFKVYSPELTVLTNIRKSYLDNRVNLPENKGKTKLQIFIDETTSKLQPKNNAKLVASEPEEIQIGNTKFTKIIYTQKNNTFGVDHDYINIYYFAVNNDRPYYLNISDIQNDSGGVVSIYESFIKSFKFLDVDQSKLSMKHTPSNVLGANTVSAEELPEGTANTIADIDEKTILNVVAKNQIAVVRVGTVSCKDLELKAPGQSSRYNLDNVCIAGIGSGSIVSGDGYIATNGHVVQVGTKSIASMALPMSPTTEVLLDRYEKIGKYLIEKRKFSADQLSQLMSSARAGDEDATNALYGLGGYIDENDIDVKAENNKYLIQLSNQPLKINMTNKGFEPEYTDSVVEAEFIDANFNPNIDMNSQIDISQLDTSDVAILKIKSGTYPTVALGSITDLKKGSQLTAIGFPGFVDGGLETKNKTTVPSVTQGKVQGIFSQNRYKLIDTDVPIAQGNSGGPAFDDFGFQVGLNTYGYITCPDKNCFGNGTARDVEDFRTLLKTNSIQIQTKSSIGDDWNEAVSAFSKGKYKVSTTKFESVAKNYHNNYLAEAMTKASASLIGSPSDTSSEINLPVSGKTIVLVLPIVVIGTCVTVVYFILRKRRKNNKIAPAGPYAQTNLIGVQSISSPSQQFSQPVQTQIPQSYAQPAQTTQNFQQSQPQMSNYQQPVQVNNNVMPTQALPNNQPASYQPVVSNQVPPNIPQPQVVQPNPNTYQQPIQPMYQQVGQSNQPTNQVQDQTNQNGQF